MIHCVTEFIDAFCPDRLLFVFRALFLNQRQDQLSFLRLLLFNLELSTAVDDLFWVLFAGLRLRVRLLWSLFSEFRVAGRAQLMMNSQFVWRHWLELYTLTSNFICTLQANILL